MASFVLLFASCGKDSPKPSHDYMVLDQIEYVKEFPVSIDLPDKGQDTGFDIIGITHFQIFDSLLFVSLKGERNGFWQFYSMENRQLVGKMLGIGQGPNELPFQIYSENDYSIKKKNGELTATIFNSRKGEEYRLNISNTLENSQLDMKLISSGISRRAVTIKETDGNAFLCREVSNTMTQQNRYLLIDGEKKVPDVLQKLNLAEVVEGEQIEDMNIISTSIRESHGIFLEVPIYLNYINLYSLDGKLSKTICPEKELSNISSILRNSDSLRKHTYTAVATFDAFFGVSFYNHTWTEQGMGLEKSSQIQLFDWSGKPLAAINVNRIVTSFDIYFARGELYLFSSSDDEFVKYDISDLLSQLNDIISQYNKL